MKLGTIVLVIALLALIGVLGICAYSSQSSSPGKEAAPAVLSSADQQLQAERLDLINELIDKGVFQKVEVPASRPHVWVTPLFHALDFDMKQTFVSVVYAYYHTADPQMVGITLYDSKTGKETGRYAPVYGGLKLD